MTNELATTTENNASLPSTITINSPAEKNRALRALSASVSLAKAVTPGEAFDVVDIFQTPGTRRSRVEGMPDVPCINTYFLLADGRSLMTQSNGIASSAQMLLSKQMYPDCGRSTEKGFLTLCVVEQKLDNGNTLKSVIPMD
jgi:hypothetical protein